MYSGTPQTGPSDKRTFSFGLEFSPFIFKVILHQFWVKKIFPWKFNLEYGGTFTELYSCMFQVEICSQQLEICKSMCMFIVLAIVVETN
jgi:hypothetical protein